MKICHEFNEEDIKEAIAYLLSERFDRNVDPKNVTIIVNPNVEGRTNSTTYTVRAEARE